MKKCLLIIDTQIGFINKNTKHIPSLVEKLQYEFEYVYVTKFFNPRGSFYRTLIKWNKLSKSSKEFELAFKARNNATIIEKSIYSCITREFLDDLQLKGITKVYICGIDTDICVTKCAVDLFENSIEPIILKDYCASTAGKVKHQNALSTLKRFIGKKQII